MAWVHAVIDVPSEQLPDLAGFWSRVLGWPAGEPWSDHPELSSFEPPEGDAYLHLQDISGPPRVHIDLDSDDPDAMVLRAGELGATYVGESELWRTLRSPGGLPFCVVAARPRKAPQPVTWPDGHRTRAVQVCIDAPRDVCDREVAFWRDLLPGRWVGSSAPEFLGKWHDDAGSPIQLLFQRLDEQSGPVRAHLDLGADDVEAEVRRLTGLGAEDLGPGRGWHVLRDPGGQVFCVTGNSPATTGVRDLG